LSNDTNLKFYSPKLRETILKLGKVAKIIDDIIDLTDDLSDRRWNYILIKACEKYPSIFNRIDKIDDFEITQLIINNGIIDESIFEACNIYNNSLTNLKNMGLYTNDFEQYMKLFFSNWYK
jgi:geranylgeranyl pyrophosphate synthase